jgi:prophage antirepressor-like protein
MAFEKMNIMNIHNETTCKKTIKFKEKPSTEIYVFGEYHIRHVLDDEGQRWFHLKDACDALGIQNSWNWAGKVDIQKVEAIDKINRKQLTNFVLANDLYSKIIPRSRAQGAEKFKKWMGRVMNSVIETGKYDITKDPAFEALKHEMQELQLESKQHIARLENNLDEVHDRLEFSPYRVLANTMNMPDMAGNRLSLKEKSDIYGRDRVSQFLKIWKALKENNNVFLGGVLYDCPLVYNTDDGNYMSATSKSNLIAHINQQL